MAKEHNAIEIERAVLGLLLSNHHLISNTVGYISEEEFYDKRHRIIFATLEELASSDITIEIAAIINRLREKGQLTEIGSEAYIGHLIQSAALESNLTKFIKVISEKAHLRKVKYVVNQLSKDLDKEDVDANELIEKVETDILASTRDTAMGEFESAEEIIKKTIKNIEMRQTSSDLAGIPTNWTDFDSMTSGFQKGDLVILAARPSMGKTAFALNIAAAAAKNNSVAFFSLEMPKEHLMARVLSSVSYVDGYKFKKNAMTKMDWEKINIAQEQISNYKLFIDDTPGLTLSELMWKAKKHHKNHPIDMILIDYMQLIAGPKGSSGDNRQAEVSAISRGLKQLARELNVPLIALSQLSRRVEQREDKRPMMSDIRESGAIEQDADLIMFLYREAYYQKVEDQNQEEMRHQTTKVIIAKHRNGAIGDVDLAFDPSIGLFTDKIKGDL
ncbi:replicative DNA helicase [Mycoplasma marinum]|uniref:Replicative DNA helicase n=1 Tax=Mycoplasma marinum TaxID=1937190 RepID=A0A4R0XTI5_9MOLU|nr:replicative DNA helicase [Mycoplasma marinum]TCG10949.1 replicative DNA helicase [Mycoplasma marinum]